MDQSKEIRALYLKKVIPGDYVTIELTAPVGHRNEENEYKHVAEKGTQHSATMRIDGWELVINDHIKRSTVEVKIPLAQGRVRR